MSGNGKYESKVKPFLADIKKWYEFSTEKQIAEKLGVTEQSFHNYKKQHPELREALKSGRQELVAELKSKLKEKAHGFHYTETKKIIRVVDGVKTQLIEEYDRYSPPDTGAIHLLLKNLDEEWRNDDKPTIQMKREELELKKAEAKNHAEDDGQILEALETIKNGAKQ